MTEPRPLERTDRPKLEALLRSVDAFTDEERAVALELVDAALADPTRDDYRFLLSFDAGAPDELAGYLCFGRTPMTQATYDLYWIATAPKHARAGVAKNLLASMERAIMRAGGGTIRVETGSREGHGAAVRFYDATGFTRAANIPDFYAPGDDLIVFTRRLDALPPDVALTSEPALIDAAFGYRDHAAERSFLLACAARFGRRVVRRVIAWASGPGRHLLAFADVGVAGVGVEASPEMIAYAERLAMARGSIAPSIRFVRGGLDATPHDVAAADLSFVPLSSIHTLLDEAAIRRHLASAARSLEPGGVHVVEATHPADLTPAGVHHTEWTERRAGDVIEARFKMHLDKASAERVVPVTLDVTAIPAKKNGDRRPSLHQEDRWFVPDLAAWRRVLEGVPELELAATLGDFDVDVPFEHPSAWRLLLVLRKIGAP